MSMWWRKKEEKPLSEQLTEARDNLQRQLEILEYPARNTRGSRNEALIATLKAELREIEDSLANLKAEDA
jgi:hypothetical protein